MTDDPFDDSGYYANVKAPDVYECLADLQRATRGCRARPGSTERHGVFLALRNMTYVAFADSHGGAYPIVLRLAIVDARLAAAKALRLRRADNGVRKVIEKIGRTVGPLG